MQEKWLAQETIENNWDFLTDLNIYYPELSLEGDKGSPYEVEGVVEERLISRSIETEFCWSLIAKTFSPSSVIRSLKIDKNKKKVKFNSNLIIGAWKFASGLYLVSLREGNMSRILENRRNARSPKWRSQYLLNNVT